MQSRDPYLKTLLASAVFSMLSSVSVLAEEKAPQPAANDTQGVNLSPEELEAIQAAAAAAEHQKGKAPVASETMSKDAAPSTETHEAKASSADTKAAQSEKPPIYVRPEYKLHNQAAPSRSISKEPGSVIRGD